MPDVGFHNADLTKSRKRLREAGSYKDLSTVIITPSRADGTIAVKVAQSHASLMKPMNQRVHQFSITGKEVGAAYNDTIADILGHPELGKWKYILTLEDDNIPPPDGLLKLYESIEKGPYAAVGGLYWTKGYSGMPMIYGSPFGILDFVPQQVRADTIQECNGLGMGFTLFRLDVFRDIPAPWFKTVQEVENGSARMMTQDLYFFEKVRKAGYKVACDTRVKVGHFDHAGAFGPPEFVW